MTVSSDVDRPSWERPLKVAGSVLWALLPLLTVGLGTAAVMAHAASRMRSALQAASVLLYVAALSAVLLVDRDHGGWQETLFDIAMTINVGLGVVHTFAIRSRVWGLRPDMVHPSREQFSMLDRQRQELAALREEAEAREAALKIVAADPALAQEMRIGRADIGRRRFPAGGLVGVNNVPPARCRGSSDCPPPPRRRSCAPVGRSAGSPRCPSSP